MINITMIVLMSYPKTFCGSRQFYHCVLNINYNVKVIMSTFFDIMVVKKSLSTITIFRI